jgi:hypothetical protein
MMRRRLATAAAVVLAFVAAALCLRPADRPSMAAAYERLRRGVVVVRFDSEGLVADKPLLGISASTVHQKFIRLREWTGW